MSDIKNTRDYAAKLRRVADFLDSRPEFEIDWEFSEQLSFYSKDKFVAAVKALGSAKKTYTEGEHGNLIVTPEAFPEFSIRIQRSSVCRKVVKFECDPLFSEDEVEAL